ncbi:DoxX family protein [Actinomycetospora sp. CA-101289]|uniref:DoxX family protein n=1 Tax=Actinomycetospora sp. CA-101289 TaxID=3239893 RepID=UPI003D99F346
MLRLVARVLLGLFLLFAGAAHLTGARQEFRAQVPSWFPADPDLVVLVSGVVEIVLGLALVLLVRHRVAVGLVVAASFVAVFPGNVAQFVEQRPAFGLDTDLARGLRLLGQPVLVAWALWSTDAATWLRDRLRRLGRRGASRVP